MKEIWKNLKNWQRIMVIVGPLVMVAVIVVAVVINVLSEPKVRIEFAENENIPADEIRNIRERLVGVIEGNIENFNGNTVYVGKARNYKEEVDGEFTTATFIVDFDDIRQSYLVTVTWPDPDDGSLNMYISCPILDSKYPETKCVTEANSSTEIISYLPYTGKLADGRKYEMTYNYSNNGFYITVNVDSCGDTKIVEEALKEAKNWLGGFGFDLNNYLFFAPTNICNGVVSKNIPYSYVIANHATTNDENVNKYLPYFIPGMYNVYPVVDENNNVTSIQAELSGCTDYQTDPMEEQVRDYLNGYGINYPVEFEYCVE